MFRDPDFRKNLLVSIITSVLVLIFIEPILKWSGNAIMWLGANTYDGITNSFYKSAALGFREKFSFVTFGLMLSTLAGIFSGISMEMLRPPRHNNTPVESRQKRRKILIVIMTGLFLLVSLYIITLDFAELQLNSSFNQRITVLAASAPDQKIKELRASWSLMEKRSDYESLTSGMDILAKQYNIKLPAALWL